MKILILVLALVAGFTYSQFVNNVRLVAHTAYMINVLQEVVSDLEQKEWCNLKVPNIISAVNETVLDKNYFGTVTYSNGFMESMQHIDIRQAGVDQVWTWNTTDLTGTVLVRGTLRMLDVALGYDVVADLEDGLHRYTMAITFPLTQYTINIRKNVHTEEVTVNVDTLITMTTVARIKMLPADDTSDVLTTMFNVRLPEEGLTGWAEDVLAPTTLNAYSKVEFPRICYDCPITAT